MKRIRTNSQAPTLHHQETAREELNLVSEEKQIRLGSKAER